MYNMIKEKQEQVVNIINGMKLGNFDTKYFEGYLAALFFIEHELENTKENTLMSVKVEDTGIMTQELDTGVHPIEFWPEGIVDIIKQMQEERIVTINDLDHLVDRIWFMFSKGKYGKDKQ